MSSLIILIGSTVILGAAENVSVGNAFSSILGLVTFVVIIVCAIKSYLYKLPSSGLFLCAFACFMIGVVTFLLANLGAIENNWFTLYSLQIGTSLKIVLFAFALADKINVLKKENEEKHIEIIKYLKENELLQTKVNMELEQKVIERTREIQEKNEEIALQNEELLQQTEALLNTTSELEKHNEKTISSIRYALRIQRAMLPSEEVLSSIMKQHFVFHLPKDVVSGDFYWAAKSDNYHSWAVCDCTGHGVPGALMSTIGSSLLNEIFFERQIFSAAEVLGLMRESLIKVFRYHVDGYVSRDSIDMALCVYDLANHTIDFAGARIPLWLMKANGELVEFKPDRQTVGVYGDELTPFKSHKIVLEKDDAIYLFSDGIVDQFGGPFDRKFSKNNLRHLIEHIYTWPLDEQREHVRTTILEWQGKNTQTDDITLMCVKV